MEKKILLFAIFLILGLIIAILCILVKNSKKNCKSCSKCDSCCPKCEGTKCDSCPTCPGCNSCCPKCPVCPSCNSCCSTGPSDPTAEVTGDTNMVCSDYCSGSSGRDQLQPLYPSYQGATSYPSKNEPGDEPNNGNCWCQLSNDLKYKWPSKNNTKGAEYSSYILCWEATPTLAMIPSGTTLVYLFVGGIVDSNGSIEGFFNGTGGNTFTEKSFIDFINGCHTQGIKVMISLGGHGGRYDDCWNYVTQNNISTISTALYNFCSKYGLDGVDFDYERWPGGGCSGNDDTQMAIVGTLIKTFKAQSGLKTSLCVNPGSCWIDTIKPILVASMSGNTSTIDCINVMTYTQGSMSETQGWINTWQSKLNSLYNFQTSQINVGVDIIDQTGYKPKELKDWAQQNGFGVFLWCIDPSNIIPPP